MESNVILVGRAANSNSHCLTHFKTVRIGVVISLASQFDRSPIVGIVMKVKTVTNP
jgi:hypothetical protein